MKFDRLALIKRLNDTAAGLEAQSARQVEQALLAERRRVHQYLADTSEAWADFASLIRRRLRKGEPIQKGDVPTELCRWRQGDISFFAPQDAGTVKQATHLRALVRVLEACTDETVSLTEIQRNGFTLGKLL